MQFAQEFDLLSFDDDDWSVPAPVSLVVEQANEFDTVASTEFLSSYFAITRKTKRTFVK